MMLLAELSLGTHAFSFDLRETKHFWRKLLIQFIHNRVSKKMLSQLLVPFIYEGANKSLRAG